MGNRNIRLSSPDITDLEINAVTNILKTPNLSRASKLLEFEENIARYIGVPYAIGVNSGTSALHLAVRSLGLKEGDEVITTPFSFIASSNCLLMERVNPVFVDIDSLDCNINPSLIEEKITEKTKAILPVHIFGHPSKMDRINEIAKNYNLRVIEDACESLGAEYKGERVGKNADVSALAFYPNKQITTGEGGMILTSNEEIAKLCRSMRNHGSASNSRCGEYQRLGYNYWMDEMSAALGVAQFSRIEEILFKRKKVAENYKARLKHLEEISLPYESPDSKISWFVYVVRVNEGIRDKVLNHLQISGIGCRQYFSPIHLQKHYRGSFGYKEGDFPVTEKISKQTIALPFYNNLKEGDIDYVATKLKEAIQK